jgi:hypothetical protein
MTLLGAAVQAQNGFLPECTTSYHHYDVPYPTRRGMFISHFSDNGAPQSIVTPSDSDTTCEVPEPLNGDSQPTSG